MCEFVHVSVCMDMCVWLSQRQDDVNLACSIQPTIQQRSSVSSGQTSFQPLVESSRPVAAAVSPSTS